MILGYRRPARDGGAEFMAESIEVDMEMQSLTNGVLPREECFGAPMSFG